MAPSGEWSGCSLGGMQGFNAAHHFPEDYDGIIVERSGNPFALINAAQLYPAWLITKDPARFIPESRIPRLRARRPRSQV